VDQSIYFLFPQHRPVHRRGQYVRELIRLFSFQLTVGYLQSICDMVPKGQASRSLRDRRSSCCSCSCGMDGPR
jgi:hypothetical protein